MNTTVSDPAHAASPGRVLHLIATNFFGGPERQILGHARAADARQYQIIIAAFAEHGQETELVRRAKNAGLAAETIWVRNAYDLRAVHRIRDLITRTQSEIVVTHGYRSNLLGRRAARTCGAKHVAVSRGWTTENLKVRCYHWLDRITLKRSDLVVCVSQEKKAELLRAGAPEERLVVIYNAVSIHDDKVRPTLDWRAESGWEPSAPLVVSAGRLSGEKGPDVFLAAIPAVLKTVPHARFILFGDGPMAGKLRSSITNLGLDKIVRLAGHVADLPPELPAFEALVNASRSEGMPNVILEAMAAGLPVVATAVGGVPELISDRLTGRLVPAEDSAALAQAICDTLLDPQSAVQWAQQARSVAQERFSFAVQAQQYEAVYDRLLRIGSTPT